MANTCSDINDIIDVIILTKVQMYVKVTSSRCHATKVLSTTVHNSIVAKVTDP